MEFEQGVHVGEYIGWRMTSGNGDVWTILRDEYYKDGIPIARKELIKYIKTCRKFPPRSTKKMMPNKRDDVYDSESN
jgi:hypothetical protein